MLATGEPTLLFGPSIAHLSVLLDRRYTEAVSLFRTQQDSIWNASVLEGQCILEMLEAWSLGDSLVMSSRFPVNNHVLTLFAAHFLRWEHPS